MKLFKSSAIAFCTLLSAFLFSSCSTPADYCESMLQICSNLDKDVKVLNEKIAEGDAQTIRATYDANLEQINKVIQDIQNKGAYRDNKGLYEAALNYAKTYKDIYENQYSLTIDILGKENKTQADKDTLSVLLGEVSTQYEAAKKGLIDSFRKFAAEYDLTPVN